MVAWDAAADCWIDGVVFFRVETCIAQKNFENDGRVLSQLANDGTR